jgi:hypothetical protein
VRVGLALDQTVADKHRLDLALDQALGRLADEDRIRVGQTLQALRDVDRISEHCRSTVRPALHLADHRGSSIDSDTESRPGPVF